MPVTAYLRTPVLHAPYKIMYPIYGEYKLSLKDLIHSILTQP